MNKIKQWCDAIRQEDGHKLSIGSLRTLKMIEDEFSGSVCICEGETGGYRYGENDKTKCSTCGKEKQTDC